MSNKEEIQKRIEARKQAIKEKRKRERIEKLPAFIKNRLLKDESSDSAEYEEYNEEFNQAEDEFVADENYIPEDSDYYIQDEETEEEPDNNQNQSQNQDDDEFDDDDFDFEQELTVTKFSDPDISTVKDDDIIIDDAPAEEKTEEQESLEEFVSAIFERRVEDGKSVANEQTEEEEEDEEEEEEEPQISEEEIEDIHTNSTESLEDILNEDFGKKESEDESDEESDDDKSTDAEESKAEDDIAATRVISKIDLENKGFDEMDEIPEEDSEDKENDESKNKDDENNLEYSDYDEEYDEYYDDEDAYYRRNRARKAYKPSKRIPLFVFVIIFILIAVGYVFIVSFVNSSSYEKNTSTLNKLYDASNEDKNSEGIFENLEPYIKINKDTVGYIILNDTEASGPVVQGKNNTYYLSHDFYKKASRYSARFLDYRNKIDGKGPTDKNTVIYGEYTADNIMFAQINKYRDISFYKNHPTYTFRTLNSKSEWKIFACFVTNSTEKYGKLFDYTKIDLSGDSFINFVKEAKKRSMMDTPVGVKESDQIMTLVTNSSLFPDAKFVVMARKIRKNEVKEINLAKVKENEDALYPDIWYSVVDKSAIRPTED